MSRISDDLLVELIQRRNLPPEDPEHVSTERFKAFLDGRLVMSDEATKVGEGRIISTAEFVERMIKAGYHKATEGGRGMKASAYRKMWSRTVVQPVSYAGRFDQILLVDLTIKVPRRIAMANFCFSVRPEECRDLVLAPVGKDGKPVSRYIAFVQLGEKNLNRTVEDCRASFAPDEVGLVTLEGLHLLAEYEAHLRKFVVDLAGSDFGGWRAPCVCWFTDGRPHLDADGVQSNPRSSDGSASRGSEVIEVA